MNPGPYIVYNMSKLSKIFRLYRSMGLRHLPVINDANEVVGILTRKELMTDFKQDLFWCRNGSIIIFVIINHFNFTIFHFNCLVI